MLDLNLLFQVLFQFLCCIKHKIDSNAYVMHNVLIKISHPIQSIDGKDFKIGIANAIG